MKKFLLIGLISVVMTLAVPAYALAAPGENASHVAFCATQMGGQHVANCAQIMDKGVSQCARMKGPCDTQ